jgi:hypothetical protein
VEKNLADQVGKIRHHVRGHRSRNGSARSSHR